MPLGSPETIAEEPTSAEIADACRQFLDTETCEEIAAMDLEEAIGFAFTALLEAGEDPMEILQSFDVLE